MPGGEQNLRQQIQEQTVQSARDFYGGSLGRLKGRLQGDRAQLEDLAKQVPESDAQARIRNMVDSYSKIEASLDQRAHDLGVEEAVNEAPQRAQEAGGQAAQEAQEAAGGMLDQATGAVGQVAGLAGQVAEGAQEAVSQVVGQIGQVAENLPGGQLLSRTTNEAGQTVQRVVDESGDILEMTLDEEVNLVDENLVGNLTDLPAEEEHQNEEGQTIRTVKEESGTLMELQLGEDGSTLDLQIPPNTEEVTEQVEETTRQVTGGGDRHQDQGQ